MAASIGPQHRKFPAEVVVIPYGFDPHLINAPLERITSRRLLSIPENAVVLCYIGRLSNCYKADLEPLLIATKTLIGREPRVHLVIGGQDMLLEYAPSLMELSQELGLSQNVSIVPNFPPALKPVLLAAADIFVSPVDNIQETFGLALVDAMACGLPIVASDWSGYREIIRHGETGFLVPTWQRKDYLSAITSVEQLCDATEKARFLAARTVIDVQALSFFLGRLVADEHLRTQFGAEAKKIAYDQYLWRNIIVRLNALWAEQLKTLQSVRGQNIALLDLQGWSDLGEIFGHYASDEISDHDLVSVSPEGFKHLMSLTFAYDTEGKRQAMRLAEEMGNRTLSWRDVVQGSFDRQEALMWLAKKGIVTVSSSRQSRGSTNQQQTAVLSP
ncbi:MAG: glycosyltransferase family 4 protein [Acidobacteriota bacterium]|nr:glycosyltransferase family 4 protein [Acidobacteriota bacterium]